MSIEFQKQGYFIPDFLLKIKDVEIPQRAINNLIIQYDMFKPYVYGEIEIVSDLDIYPLIEFDGECEMSLKATDGLKFSTLENFILHELSSTKMDNNQFCLRGKFYDVASHELQKYFICKSFKDKRLQDLINEFKDDFDKTKKDTDYKDTETLEYFIFNPSLHVLDNIDNISDSFGVRFFHTHSKLKILPLENILSQKLKKIGNENMRAVFPPEVDGNPFNIIEYKNTDLQGLNVAQQSVKRKMYSYNPLDRKNTLTEYNLKQANEDLGLLDDNTEKSGEGIVFSYYSNTNAEIKLKQDLRIQSLFNSQFSFLQGGCLGLDVGDTILLDISNGKDLDKQKSGKYLVSSVTDKYTQGYLTQMVRVVRPSPAKE